MSENVNVNVAPVEVEAVPVTAEAPAPMPAVNQTVGGLTMKQLAMGVGSNMAVVAATNVALLAGSKLIGLAASGFKKGTAALKARAEAKKALKEAKMAQPVPPVTNTDENKDKPAEEKQA